MSVYGLFILDTNLKCVLCSILYGHINVPMVFKELSKYQNLFSMDLQDEKL